MRTNGKENMPTIRNVMIGGDNKVGRKKTNVYMILHGITENKMGRRREVSGIGGLQGRSA